MKWFIKALNQYADFSGRARRSEYWFFILFSILFYGAAFAVDSVFVSAELYSFPVITVLYALAIILPSLAVLVRRLHDTNRSGMYYFLTLIPVIGSIVVLVFLCQDSYPKTNNWGPDPKAMPLMQPEDNLIV